MKKLFLVIFITLCAFMVITCMNQKTEWKWTIQEVDGVTIVRNPKEPIYDENLVTLTEEISIGVGEEAEEYLFAAIGIIHVDDEGNIMVADSIESVIKVFDTNGRFVRSIGKKGQGPGEFARLNGLQITPRGELLVADNINRRLSFFSYDGELVNTIPLKTLPSASNNWQIDSRGNIIMETAQFTQDGKMAIEIQIYGSDFEFVKVLCKAKPFDFSIPFHPFHSWNLSIDDHVVYGYNDSYELQIYNQEWQLVKIIKKDYDPVKIKTEEIEEELKRKNLPPGTKIPNFYPAFIRFVVDDTGKIFVRTWERSLDAQSFYYDVFDAEGRYLTRFPFHAIPKVIKKDKIYTVEEDEEGLHILKRYAYCFISSMSP